MTQQSALATAEPKREIQTGTDGQSQDLMVVEAAITPQGLRRHETIVTIPPDYQYKIPRREKVGNEWQTFYSVGLTIDAYDYLNRAVGASFFLPDIVHDENNEPKRNPIHRKDYIYLRMGCVWYTPLGQLVMAMEDVEVDFRLAYMESRVSARSADPVLKDGFPIFNDQGDPVIALSKEDELRALRQFATSRNFGPRYAQSVARVRLLKMATGIRSLPIELPRPFPIKVVGFTDQLTPQERVEKVAGATQNLYGRPDDIQPMSAQEMAAVGVEVDGEEDIDRAAVEAAIANETEMAGQATPDTETEHREQVQHQEQQVWPDDGLPPL